jgi:hypothetical protein
VKENLEPTGGLEPLTCRLRIAHRHPGCAGTRVNSGDSLNRVACGFHEKVRDRAAGGKPWGSS